MDMGYTALYRKYRPKTFDEVVGQDYIIQTLKNAVKKNRIAHAYLFTGPRGTGKTSIAKIFARAVNCTGEDKPCGECSNCKMALDGSHPDIIEIDAASNNGVDEVRTLIDRVQYAPMEGRYKVYIIDEVHMMSTGAFNALLKTIEEPPEYVIFIFATTEPHKVLPTILSRCQRYDFSKVSQPDIERRLNEVCQAENIQIEPAAISMIASLADGGMRDALSILDQCYAFNDELISEQVVRDIYGIATDEEIHDIYMNVSQGKPQEAIDLMDHLSQRGIDLKRFTADFISLLKDSLLYSFSDQSDKISDSRKKYLNDGINSDPAQKRIFFLDELIALYNKLSYASNALDYLESLFLKVSFQYQAKEPMQTAVQTGNMRNQIAQTTQSGQRKQNIDSQKHLNNQPTAPKTLSSIFWGSDVSRETNVQSHTRVNHSDIDQEKLLGLLVGADKGQKKSDQIGFSHMNEYEDDPKFAKYVSALRNFRMVASGENYLILSFPTQMQSDEVNELESKEGFENFMKIILGKPKMIFGLSNDMTNKLLSEFKRRMKSNSLPSKYEINMKVEEKEIPSEEKKPEDIVKEIFEEVEIRED